MRISDWSSDVCSSDLRQRAGICRNAFRERGSLWPAGGYKAGDHCHPFDANRDKQQESDRQPWSAEYLRHNLIYMEPLPMLVEVMTIQRWGQVYSQPSDLHPRLKDGVVSRRHTDAAIVRRWADKQRRRRRGDNERRDQNQTVG